MTKRAFMLFLTVCILSISITDTSVLASVTYRKYGLIMPAELGLGAKDIITFTVVNNDVRDISVRQLGAGWFGILTIAPEGYEINETTNTVYTYWKMNLSFPLKILSISLGLTKTVRSYNLYPSGSMVGKIIK